MAKAEQITKEQFQAIFEAVMTFSERNELAKRSEYHTDTVSFIGVDLSPIEETPETLTEQIERILRTRDLQGDGLVTSYDDDFDDDGFDDNVFNSNLHQSSYSELDVDFSTKDQPVVGANKSIDKATIDKPEAKSSGESAITDDVQSMPDNNPAESGTGNE